MSNDGVTPDGRAAPAPRPWWPVHRAWWVAGVSALIIMTAGWTTGVPNMLTEPVLGDRGWSRGTVGAAFAVNIALYGAVAPFAAAAMDRFGVRRVVIAALVAVSAGSSLTALMSSPWQLAAGWGLLVGSGSGSISLTFGALITERWFQRRRGLVSGLLTSCSMFGGMVLMPLQAWLMSEFGWRVGILVVGSASTILIPMAILVVRDHPSSVGAAPFGAEEWSPAPPRGDGGLRRAISSLRTSLTSRVLWMVALSFGICGASTNGVMMTHFVPATGEAGMPGVVAASLLATMGVCNVLGASASGWLTDTYSPPTLLVGFYALRGVTLVVLPSLIGPLVGTSLIAFAVVYGLLDLATVPPTISLCREHFGARNGPIIFGWVNAVHALGASAAAYLGSVGRDAVGSYDVVWYGSGALCVVAAILVTRLGRTRDSYDSVVAAS